MFIFCSCGAAATDAIKQRGKHGYGFTNQQISESLPVLRATMKRGEKKLKLGVTRMPRPGETVLVPTNVKAGAFPGEKLVTVSTAAGPISGFTKSDAIVNRGGGQYIVAEVKNATSKTLTVKLSGSFFTTTGLAEVPSSLVLKAAG
jgi:hypothetical protein